MSDITLEWFFKIPGLFITGGFLLILIALAVFFISAGKKDSKKEENLNIDSDNMENNEDALVLNNNINEDVSFPKIDGNESVNSLNNNGVNPEPVIAPLQDVSFNNDLASEVTFENKNENNVMEPVTFEPIVFNNENTDGVMNVQPIQNVPVDNVQENNFEPVSFPTQDNTLSNSTFDSNDIPTYEPVKIEPVRVEPVSPNNVVSEEIKASEPVNTNQEDEIIEEI